MTPLFGPSTQPVPVQPSALQWTIARNLQYLLDRSAK